MIPDTAPSPPSLGKGSKRQAIKNAAVNAVGIINRSGGASLYDLAKETAGFSGADIAGLVRCAGSIALGRVREAGGGVDILLITLDDVKQALVEVKT